jgi:hypothetical protein
VTRTRYNFAAAFALVAAFGSQARADFASNAAIPESEKAGTQLVYELNVPAANPAWRSATPIPYTTDNSGSITAGAYTRIGYYMEVTNGSQAGDFVYISMDPFDTDLTRIGYPHNLNNPVARQTIVGNANIYSNNANITPVIGSATVNLEMWPSNYSKGDPVAIPNGTGRFDWSDSNFGTGSGHGSFQIHNHGLSQVLFAHNDWGGNSSGIESEFGIGNANAGGLGNPHEDWTFSDYGQSGFLQIVVTSPMVPEPATLSLLAMGLLSLPGGRGRRK